MRRICILLGILLLLSFNVFAGPVNSSTGAEMTCTNRWTASETGIGVLVWPTPGSGSQIDDGSGNNSVVFQ